MLTQHNCRVWRKLQLQSIGITSSPWPTHESDKRSLINAMKPRAPKNTIFQGVYYYYIIIHTYLFYVC